MTVAFWLPFAEKMLLLSTSLPDGSYKPTSGKKFLSPVDTVIVIFCPVSPLKVYPSATAMLLNCPVTVSPILILELECRLEIADNLSGNDPGIKVLFTTVA